MTKRLAWEKNWLLAHGWSWVQIEALEQKNDETPVEYLTGTAEFGSLDLRVSPAVLIPRPETLELARHAAKTLVALPATTKDKIIAVDVGTGSGAIALLLARALERSCKLGRILATDLSTDALSVARENITRYRQEKRVEILHSDLLAALPLEHLANSWILVANLPYIPTHTLATLPLSVQSYEPHQALDGGEDGWRLIARLLAQARTLPRPPAAIFLEVDPRHDESFLKNDTLYLWRRRHDQFGRWRFWSGQLSHDF